jgi:hypothetical protein
VRQQTLFAAADTACEGAPLTLTGLGRWSRITAKVKHAIKRTDRLLLNRQLHRERFEVYAAQAALILGGVTQPIVVVDWSDLSHDRRWQLLRASVPVGGRALRTNPGNVAMRSPKMREECVSVLLDHLVEQCLLGTMARVAPLRRDEGGKPVRLRARLDSEHSPD